MAGHARISRQLGVNIANGATQSDAVKFHEFGYGVFSIPAAFTGTAVSFEVSHDGAAWIPLRTAADAPVSVTVSASHAYALPVELAGCQQFRFVSNAAEAGARVIRFHAKS